MLISYPVRTILLKNALEFMQLVIKKPTYFFVCNIFLIGGDRLNFQLLNPNPKHVVDGSFFYASSGKY